VRARLLQGGPLSNPPLAVINNRLNNPITDRFVLNLTLGRKHNHPMVSVYSDGMHRFRGGDDCFGWEERGCEDAEERKTEGLDQVLA
jgi:hypothetical protein